MNVAKEVWGVDISAEGIELLRKHGIDNIVVGDVEHIDQIEELKQQKFDIILATEVLEHLNNPGIFLQRVKKLFSSDTVMIITVPNGLRLTGLGYTLRGYEFVHPDHNYWFSYKTLETLLEKNGYQIDEMLVYSFFDYTTPLLKKISEKISVFHSSKAKLEGISTMLNETKEKGGAENRQQQNILKSSLSLIKWMLEYLIRRYFYHRNPFFVSDGIIVVVKKSCLEKTVW